MDNADLEDVIATVRSLVRDRVIPLEAEIDATDEIPAGLRAEAAQMGLFGFAIPEEYGGLGLTMSQETRLVMELGYTTPAFRSMFGTNNGIAGHVLLEGGSEEQKKLYLPRLASGEWTASFALTEENAGSDPAGLVTSVARVPEGTPGDGGWVINGLKRFITNAPVADVFMVFARHADGTAADPAAGKISVLMVEAGTPGVAVGPKDEKMGQHGAWTSDVRFDDVRVPAATLIGAPGEGYLTAMRCLAHGRLHIAALCVGLAQRALDETITYALSRTQGGHVIADYQLIQGLIADSQTDVLAGRSLVLSAAADFDSGADRRLGPSCAKYFASEMVGRVADRAVQVHGGVGYMRGVTVERIYRDARLFRIYEGTSQIQQLVIAKQALRAGSAR
ncbi:MAG TPA: acyl-CoA dehydrogenase family protein [Trebonia sp.]|jgi:acyl-CoA dehydrogenase|nr:acyl-CoA dehydrogenase family protein [Trebonia sp.]